MHLSNLLTLPPTVILLLCASPLTAAEPQWPHNLPKHMKYFPEDEAHVKRNLDIQDRLKRERPIGVKKMSSNEGEMFFLDNWIFASDVSSSNSNNKRTEPSSYTNGTCAAQPPLRPHAEQMVLDSILQLRARNALMKRDFRCPEGTNDCSSIGAPNSCCGTGDTCINIEDTGYGSVGCCPQGQTCEGQIRCDTERGYSDCPDSDNGGCCLPGYTCQGVGCVVAGTSITYVQPPSSTPRPSPSTSTAVIVVPTTPSPSPSSTSAYTCSSGWFSCPSSLGGGCCQNGLQCATGASCIGDDSSTVESSMAPSAPVRPTSNSPAPSDQPTTEPGVGLCPSGFYVCSAYYPSGCCRVGRDCQTTGSCIPTSSATIIATNGVTIVAPSGAGVATTAAPQGGTCPQNWYMCPASRGGNCCPNGFECGEQCTATASGQSGIEGKVAPSTASFIHAASVWMLVTGAIGAGIAMIAL